MRTFVRTHRGAGLVSYFVLLTLYVLRDPLAFPTWVGTLLFWGVVTTGVFLAIHYMDVLLDRG